MWTLIIVPIKQNAHNEEIVLKDNIRFRTVKTIVETIWNYGCNNIDSVDVFHNDEYEMSYIDGDWFDSRDDNDDEDEDY